MSTPIDNSKKQQLPYGWIVKQSLTYPDRIYYFNTFTGSRTWDIPELCQVTENQDNLVQTNSAVTSVAGSPKQWTELKKTDSIDSCDFSSAFKSSMGVGKSRSFTNTQDDIIDMGGSNPRKSMSDVRDCYIESVSNPSRKRKVIPGDNNGEKKTRYECDNDVSCKNLWRSEMPQNATTNKRECHVIGSKVLNREFVKQRDVDKMGRSIKGETRSGSMDRRAASAVKGRIVKSVNAKGHCSAGAGRFHSINSDRLSRLKQASCSIPLGKKNVIGSGNKTFAENFRRPIKTSCGTDISKTVALDDGERIANTMSRTDSAKQGADLNDEFINSCKRGQPIFVKKSLYSRGSDGDSGLKENLKKVVKRPSSTVTSTSSVIPHSDNVDNLTNKDGVSSSLNDAIRENVGLILRTSHSTVADPRLRLKRRISDSNVNLNSAVKNYVKNSRLNTSAPSFPANNYEEPGCASSLAKCRTLNASSPEQTSSVTDAMSRIPGVRAFLNGSNRIVSRCVASRQESPTFDDFMDVDVEETDKILPAPSKKEMPLYVTVDTNVLISHLKMVQNLKTGSFPGFEPATVVLPWVVLQELDCLKSKKNLNGAGKAVRWIHQSMKDTAQTRVRGQSAIESMDASKTFKAECNDDRIIHCCLQWSEKYPDSRSVVFTNDINLCNKCRVTDIAAFTSQELHRGLSALRSEENRRDIAPSTPTCTTVGQSTPTPTCMPVGQSTPRNIDRERLLVKAVVPRIVSTLHLVLGSVLRSEMIDKFGNLWIDVVLKKPPWTLTAILQCYNKHWMATFSEVLERDGKTAFQELLKLITSNTPGSREHLQQLLVVAEYALDMIAATSRYSACGVDAGLARIRQISTKLEECQYSSDVEEFVSALTTVQEATLKTATNTPEPFSIMANLNKNSSNSPIQTRSSSSIECPNRHPSSLASRAHPFSAVDQYSSILAGETSTNVVDQPSSTTEIIDQPSSTTDELDQSLSTDTSILSPDSLADLNDILNTSRQKFQSVWEIMHNFNATLRTSIDNGEVKGNRPAINSSLEMIVPALTSMKKSLYYCLLVPVKEIAWKDEAFEELASLLNLVDSNMSQNDPSPDVTCLHLQKFFSEKKSRKLGENGLLQLTNMMKFLHSCIQDLPLL